MSYIAVFIIIIFPIAEYFVFNSGKLKNTERDVSVLNTTMFVVSILLPCYIASQGNLELGVYIFLFSALWRAAILNIAEIRLVKGFFELFPAIGFLYLFILLSSYHAMPIF